jgi:hypothetical protein
LEGAPGIGQIERRAIRDLYDLVVIDSPDRPSDGAADEIEIKIDRK